MLARYLYGTALFALAAWQEHLDHPWTALVIASVAVYVLGSILQETIWPRKP
jgi:hypothetical protein